MAGPFTTPVAESVPFEAERNPDFNGLPGPLVAENVQDAIEEVYNLSPGNARFTITLTHNGAVSNNTFIGYLNTIPGNNSPVILAIDCQLNEFTFTNNRSGADYTLEFRKNSTTATPFLTVSKTNTQFFAEQGIAENFNSGDQVYVKCLDDGLNPRDVVICMYFRKIL